MLRRTLFGVYLGAAVMVGCTSLDAINEPLPSKRLSGVPLAELSAGCGEGLDAQRRKLGASVFFDKRTSRGGVLACSTCHQPLLGFADGEVTSLDRNGERLKRHSPSLLNLTLSTSLFWDGREQKLEKQAALVFANKNLFDRQVGEVVAALAAIPYYRDGFAKAYPDGLTEKSLLDSVSSFERGIVSRRSAFDRFSAGDESAMDESAKRGLVLFHSKANCSKCHNGPNFTDRKFHNTGVVTDDLGRIAVVRNTEFRMRPYPFFANHRAFKTPTLRNVAESAPYFHNGSIQTLAEVVEFYDRGGISTDRYGRSPEVFPLGLEEGEKADLVGFLESLNSPIEYCEPDPAHRG